MSIDNRYRKRIRGNINWKNISVDKYPRRISMNRMETYSCGYISKTIKLIDFGGISMLIEWSHIKLIEIGDVFVWINIQNLSS